MSWHHLKEDTSRVTLDMSADEIYTKLLQRSARGCKVVSMASPPLATEFVKSAKLSRAHANKDGALSELIFPSPDAIHGRLTQRHEDRVNEMFGYETTAASDAFQSGYGERATQALTREESSYQLKGTFVSAALSLTKLRARIEARGGDIDAINRIFARMWGLTEEQVEMLPHLHLSGGEVTRMAAMEDRAYHSLSGHPAYGGGFRVDLATVAPDALGSKIPINWSRLRTGLKAVAVSQTQADLEIMELRYKLPANQEVKLMFDMTHESQPEYERSVAWEQIVDRLMAQQHELPGKYEDVDRSRDVGYSLLQGYRDAYISKMAGDEELDMMKSTRAIADTVREESNRALKKTIDVIHTYDVERATLDEFTEEDFSALDSSILSRSYQVPRYKLTRTTLRKGTTREDFGRDALPDVMSHGLGKRILDRSEFREAHLTVPLTVAGALHLAVYITSSRVSMAVPAYKLLGMVKDPDPGARGPVTVRLRSEPLYRDAKIRALGDQLFSDEFMGTFETIVANMTLKDSDPDVGIKQALWDYLRGRTGRYCRCPIKGGWRDLVEYLRTAPEGWTMFYWARTTIGKLQRSSSMGILAPIAAGEEVDFLTLMKRGIRERSTRWMSFYVAKADAIQSELQDLYTEKKRLRKLECSDDVTEQHGPDRLRAHAKYIPPHLRKAAHLEEIYDDDRILNRTKGYTQAQYQKMVEAQVKSKFFKNIEISSRDRQLIVGMSDIHLRETLVEFYQVRWYSLHKRIERALQHGKHFRLGPYVFKEHPWGELSKEYPDSVPGMLAFMSELDQRAWTLEPMYIWEKFQKSIHELWDDVATELDMILTYIDENADTLADEQIEADLSRHARSILKAIPDVSAIAVPVHGYVAPMFLADKVITTSSGSKHADTHTFTDVDDCYDDDDYTLDEPAEDICMSLPVSTYHHLDIRTDRYLTLNEIWNELELDEVSDPVKKAAFGVSYTTDLDAYHVDATLGPVVPYQDRVQAAKMWSRKLEGMQRRLGKSQRVVNEDDF